MAPTDPGAKLALVKSWLLDTGPIVAYLDSSEESHLEVSTCLDGFSGRLVTTNAVVTEAMHFVSASPKGPPLLADFITAGGVEVSDFAQPTELREAVGLMEKYQDIPMDYADATLLLLAERLKVREIVTLDRRGFAAFRTRQGKALSLVLDLHR